jgi:AraC-like DNA-binding protein
MLHPLFNIEQQVAELSAIHPKKILMNDEAVIEHHVYKSNKQGSIFSSQHILMVVLNGAIHLHYGNDQHVISSGGLAFVKRNILFEYKCAGQEDDGMKTELLFFNLSYELIKEFSLLAALSGSMQLEKEDIMINKSNSQLGKYMDSILACLYCSQQMDNSFIKIKLLELLFILSGSYPAIATLLLDQRKSYRPDITTVVEENIMNTLSMQQLAVLAGRSLSSFRRDFLSIYNMPPSQWIREKRLKKAKDFLVSTNMTITDICYTLGFENIAHFSRLFKSQFGHSPSAYRLQLVSA